MTSRSDRLRDVVQEFLWRVHAADCFEQDALDILDSAGGSKIDKVSELIRVVSAELDATEMNMAGDRREDLRSLADTARRAAIMLMYAAWYADRRVPRPPPTGGEQKSLFGGDR